MLFMYTHVLVLELGIFDGLITQHIVHAYGGLIS